MVKRILIDTINKRLKESPKAIVLVGPRQTGKTTLLLNLIGEEKKTVILDGDNPQTTDALVSAGEEVLARIIGNKKIVFIDEAQQIPTIGRTLKIITDKFPDVQLYVSGSSALEINQQTQEPLTGRKWEFNLFPISWQEWVNHVGYLKAKEQLEDRLLFGSYPEVLNSPGLEKEVLTQLASSYLFKDVLSLAGVRKPEVLEKLIKALAYQMGNEVSYNELANLIQVDKNTINNYIHLLEQTFVIFKLQPFSKNLRNEISTTRKIYFYDNGLRNALISDFSPLTYRRDKGALWESFLLSERMKKNHYSERLVNTYFWRTKQGQEIDLIEESDGKIRAFEFKFASRKKAKAPSAFTKAYPDADFKEINGGNFDDFLLDN